MSVGAEVAIIDEAIVTSTHVRQFLNSRSSSQYSFPRGEGVGCGMPAAVGCSLGLGRQPVICLVGDGAALYSPQAMWTAIHENLPVTFVVMNNREYNVLKNFMKAQPDYRSSQVHRYIAMDIDRPPIDYLALRSRWACRACAPTRPPILPTLWKQGLPPAGRTLSKSRSPTPRRIGVAAGLDEIWDTPVEVDQWQLEKLALVECLHSVLFCTLGIAADACGALSPRCYRPPDAGGAALLSALPQDARIAIIPEGPYAYARIRRKDQSP